MPKLMKALLATLVVVLFAVVAMIVWRSTSDSADSRPTVLAQKQVRSLFAHQPTIDWRVPVKDAAPEGLAAPEFGNGFSYDRSGPQVIDLIDTVIVGVVDSESAGELPSMVAIDVATGEIRWRAKGDPRTCASATIDGLLPCVIGTPSGGAGDEVAGELSPRHVLLGDGLVGEIALPRWVSDRRRFGFGHTASSFTRTRRVRTGRRATCSWVPRARRAVRRRGRPRR